MFYVYIYIFYYLYIVYDLPTVCAYIEAIYNVVVTLNLKFLSRRRSLGEELDKIYFGGSSGKIHTGGM